MTVAEEVGLEGANALDGSLLTGPAASQPRQRRVRAFFFGCRRQHGHVDPSLQAPEPLQDRTDTADAREVNGETAGARRGRFRNEDRVLRHANAIKLLGRVLARDASPIVQLPARSRSTVSRAGMRFRATPSTVCSQGRGPAPAFRAAVERLRPRTIPGTRTRRPITGPDRRRNGRRPSTGDRMDCERPPSASLDDGRAQFRRARFTIKLPDFEGLVKTSSVARRRLLTEGSEPDAFTASRARRMTLRCPE